MDTQDKLKFYEIMVGMAEMYGSKLSKQTLTLYWDALNPYVLGDIQKASQLILRTARFMPKPVDFIEAIEGKPNEKKQRVESTARTQWQQVKKAIAEVGSYQTPKFLDPVTRACVTNVGWKELCKLSQEQLVWEGKRFEQLYQDYSTTHHELLLDNVKGRIDEDKQSLDDKQSFRALMEKIAPK